MTLSEGGGGGGGGTKGKGTGRDGEGGKGRGGNIRAMNRARAASRRIECAMPSRIYIPIDPLGYARVAASSRDGARKESGIRC